LRAGVGEEAGTGGLAGKRPEMARKAFFSEGRGLRVRIAMRCASRGTSSLSTSWPEAGCLPGTCPGEAQAFFNGRAEPAPPRGGPSRARWPRGEDPGITRKAIFSEGRALRVRK